MQTVKIDLFQQHRDQYKAGKTPVIVALPPILYFQLAGEGDPSGPDFEESVGAMYAVAYSVKMTSKKVGRDYKVAPLEGLWWADGDNSQFLEIPREEWKYRLLIRVPDFIDNDKLADAQESLISKGKSLRVRNVELEIFDEGTVVQVLHRGPYADEKPSVDAMLAYARENGYTFAGRHHEIYLNDPRRCAPEKMRTILRHPLKPM